MKPNNALCNYFYVGLRASAPTYGKVCFMFIMVNLTITLIA